MMSDLA
jgi:oligo-1,6-glucosidase